MNELFKKILGELYTVDPDLKKHESRIIAILESMYASRPDATIDERFVSELRQRILMRFAEKKSALSTRSRAYVIYTFMKKNLLIGGSVAVLTIVVLMLVLNYSPGSITTQLAPSTGTIISNSVSVVDRETGAFGPLAFVSGNDTSLVAQESSVAVDTSVSRPTSAPQPRAIGLGGGGGGGGDADAKMIMPYRQYRYVYSGDPIDLSDETISVLRRKKGNVDGASLSQLQNLIPFTNIDLSYFNDARLESFSMSQQKEFGYAVAVSIPEETISIYENWTQWPQPGANCRDESCWKALQLSPSDVPDDAELISIANSFLQESGISLESYALPIVNRMWQNQPWATESETYVPDIMSITYPLMIDGEPTYDEGGNPYGLGVNVNIRYNRVSSVYNMGTNVYERSEYQAVTDTEKLLSVAARGGVYGYVDPNAEEIVDVQLGTPKKALIRMGVPGAQQYQELLVPALIFPVMEQPQDSPYFYQQSVVVPLADELLVNPYETGTVMPLMAR